MQHQKSNDHLTEEHVSLPNPISDKAYEEIDFMGKPFQRAAAEVLRTNNLPQSELETFSTGSCPVFGADGKYIIKMFAPLNTQHFDVEKEMRFPSCQKLALITHQQLLLQAKPLAGTIF